MLVTCTPTFSLLFESKFIFEQCSGDIDGRCNPSHDHSPYGLGADTSFADVFDLAEAILHGATKNFLHDYEEKMFKRGFDAVADSFNSTYTMHLSGWRGFLRDLVLRILSSLINLTVKLRFPFHRC